MKKLKDPLTKQQREEMKAILETDVGNPMPPSISVEIDSTGATIRIWLQS